MTVGNQIGPRGQLASMPSRPYQASEETARGTGAHIAVLDGWRGAAILLVLFAHFIGRPGINTGPLGVELFFVLSGRLMAEILFVRRTPFDQFVVRRFSRIYPALLVAVVLTALGSVWLPQLAVTPIDVIASLTFTMKYLRAIGGDFGSPLDHVWSLCVEEHAYVIMLGIAVLHRRAGWDPARVLAVLASGCMLNGIISVVVFDQDYYGAYWRSDVRAASILCSASLYLYARAGRGLFVDHAGYWPIAAGIFGGLTHVYGVPVPITYTVGTIALAYSVVFIESAHGVVRSVLTSRPMVAVGAWSYSIYLYQQPFASLEGRVNTLLLLASAIVAALISYHLLERPVRRAINNWFAARAREKARGGRLAA